MELSPVQCPLSGMAHVLQLWVTAPLLGEMLMMCCTSPALPRLQNPPCSTVLQGF